MTSTNDTVIDSISAPPGGGARETQGAGFPTERPLTQGEIDRAELNRTQWTEREEALRARPESTLLLFWKALRRNRLALTGGIVLIAVVVLTVFAPVFAPQGPYVADPTLRLQPPGTPSHILGLDGQGRDILSRLIYGGRVSLPIALIPVAAATVVSLFLGIVAGYYRRGVGEFIMRLLDVFYAFPTVMLAIAIAGIMGPGMINIMLSIFIVLIPYMTRVNYTTTILVTEEEFVTAARACGAGDLHILLHDILPNVLPTTIVYATTSMGLQVVFAAGLSFLGLGVQPPIADWGIMTSDGRDVLSVAPHVSVIPGLVLLVVALAFNLVGDGLRDALDPKLRV